MSGRFNVVDISGGPRVVTETRTAAFKPVTVRARPGHEREALLVQAAKEAPEGAQSLSIPIMGIDEEKPNTMAAFMYGSDIPRKVGGYVAYYSDPKAGEIPIAAIPTEKLLNHGA